MASKILTPEGPLRWSSKPAAPAGAPTGGTAKGTEAFAYRLAKRLSYIILNTQSPPSHALA